MPEKSEEVKQETITTAPTPDTTNTEVSKSEPIKTETKQDLKSLKSDEIKTLLEKEPVKEEVKEETVTENKVPETKKEDEWFDKDKGWKTKEDAAKSHSELMNALRQRTEEQKRMQEELRALKTKSEAKPLSEEEKNRESAVKQWEEENKEAIDFLEKRIASRIEQKKTAETFEHEALKERGKWKEDFDKDDSRKVLWPKMEKIYAEKDIFQDFAKNPLKYIEAVAFQQEFPSIAEKVRAEGIEQYKAQLKEADEAAKARKTEIPGGARVKAGEIDVSKLSSSELGNMLGRADD